MTTSQRRSSCRRWIGSPLRVCRIWLAATSVVPMALFSGCAYARSVNDEFNGPAGAADASKWTFKGYCNFGPGPPSGSGGDRSQACNQRSQARIDGDGHLRIRATYSTEGGFPHWLTAHLSSKRQLTPPYVVAVRAKVPPGKGMWSAPAWTTSKANGGCAEVDVVEQLGRQPVGVNQSLHNWCGTHRSVTRYQNLPGAPLSDGYHQYMANVGLDRVEYFVDGKKTASIRASEVGVNLASPSTFHISLDVGSCGSWARCPPQSVRSPADMVVDWFRVFTR